MKNPKNNCIWLLCAVLLSLFLRLPAAAQAEGSLSVCKVDEPVVLFHVADSQGNIQPDFTGWRKEPLEEKDLTAKNAKKLQEYTKKKDLEGDLLEPEEEKVTFAPLEKGVYLVCSPAQKGEFAPFLVRIPTVIGEKEVYHIQATPKEETDPDPTQPGSDPEKPDDDIPQTGNIQWPKYLLLGLGGLLILVGMEEILRGRRKGNE